MVNESLWAMADGYFLDYLTPALGASSQYSDTPIKTFAAIAIRDVMDWQTWQMPALLIVSQELSREVKSYGSGLPHLDKTYPFLFVLVCDGPQAVGLANVKVLVSRLEYQLLRMPVQGLVSIDGERARRIVVKSTRMSTFKKPSSQSDSWFTAAGTEVLLEAFV